MESRRNGPQLSSRHDDDDDDDVKVEEQVLPSQMEHVCDILWSQLLFSTDICCHLLYPAQSISSQTNVFGGQFWHP